jgi:rubrerythrin
MYPGFVKEAEREGNKPALVSFKNAMAVEEIHHKLYSDALKAVQGGKDLPAQADPACAVLHASVAFPAPHPGLPVAA